MNAFILRRRALGRTSCKEIANNSKTGIAVVRNDAPIPEATVVFRWGTTSNVPKVPNQVIVNEARAIHWCADKKSSRLELQAKGVPVPETWSVDAFKQLDPAQYPDYEFVLRRAKHAQGKDLWAGTYKETIDSIRYNLVNDGYVSRLIDKVAEYRVFVCQGRVVWVAKKTPGNPDQVAWNVAQGGRFDNVRWGEWPMAACAAGINAALVSGADFCGVDVMVDADGKPYVLEVNSAPSQTSPYRQACVAKAFDYIVKNGKAVIKCEQFKKWRDVIHPAVMVGEVDGVAA